MANKAQVTVTTKEIAGVLAERKGLRKGETEELVNELVQVIFDTLVGGKNVKLTGVGVLEARSVEQGTALNPRMYTDLIEDGVDAETAKSRATVPVAAHIKPGFKASTTLKTAMKEQG